MFDVRSIRWTVVLSSLLAAVPAVRGGEPPRELTFDQRVEAQRAIEAVWWKHRIWPAQNERAKPALEAVLPEEAIRARVQDYLRKSAALEALWGRPITAAQLQAEMDRLAKGTRDPEVLGELFAALGHDPYRIAETLARQTLADRLIRNWYAYDDRFHGATRAVAETALAGATSLAALRAAGADYRESRFVRVAGEATTPRRAPDDEGANSAPVRIDVDEREWAELIDEFAAEGGSMRSGTDRGAERLATPKGRARGVLRERSDRFEVSQVLVKTDGEMVVAIAAWPKRSFEDWWGREGSVARNDRATSTAAYVLPRIEGATCSPDSWQETSMETPSGRYDHVAVWTGTEMIISGGASVIGQQRRGGRYSPATDSWTPVATAGAPRSAAALAVWTGTEMIVWGPSGVPQDRVGRYDPVTDSWSEMSASGAPTGAGTIVWTGTEAIVWGGQPGLNTGAKYDPSVDAWTPTSVIDAPEARSSHSAVWTGSEMIVWGGFDGSTGLDTGGRYDPVTDSWTPTSMAEAPTARLAHAAIWTGKEMIIWGGYGGESTGGRYDPTTDSWTPVSSVGAPENSIALAVWTGSEMILWSSSLLAGNGRYDPTSDSWSPMSIHGAPPGAGGTIVWTGTEMIAWGGFSNSGSENSGGRYDPSTDTWIPTSTSGAPLARRAHSATWTGTEMVILGGAEEGESMKSGGRYNPAMDAWTPTSMTDAYPSCWDSAVWTGTEVFCGTGGRYDPTRDAWTQATSVDGPGDRRDFSLVWTGSEVVLWGGTGATGTENTGRRYDPATDTWTTTSVVGAPEARRGHTAVWTGSEMIVWGGTSFNGLQLSTGAKYDPLRDTWAPTSVIDVPEGRHLHSAVWTGSEMIVWGGSGGTNPLIGDTGGRYNPTANTWVPTSLIDPPQRRRLHTAIWTGKEMIVWGGIIFPSTDTGGRYDPVTDSWTAISAVGGPSNRYLHSAVWTGTEMIVWGGFGADSAVGGRYCAASCADPAPWYGDADGDGYGQAGVLVWACEMPSGYVADAADCDDGSAAASPAGQEVGIDACADGLDNDCDGVFDGEESQACASAVQSLSTLANAGDSSIDSDVWRIDGRAGETVRIRLEATRGDSGRADLVLVYERPTPDDPGFTRIDRTALPNEIEVTLPSTGSYRIAVSEHSPLLLLPGPRFDGTYRLVVEGAPGGAAVSAVALESVEPTDGAMTLILSEDSRSSRHPSPRESMRRGTGDRERRSTQERRRL